MLPVKTPFTIADNITKGFFCSSSSNDDAIKAKVAQCCMVSWDDEWEEVNAKAVNTAQGVDQVTFHSRRQLQPLESIGKEKEKEMTLERPPTPGNAKGKSEEEALPSNSNSKDATKDKELIKEPKKDHPISVPFQVHQGYHKERVHYDVISHLKWIPACLSVYDTLQMSKDLRRALIQVLMDPDGYEDQVYPI